MQSWNWDSDGPPSTLRPSVLRSIARCQRTLWSAYLISTFTTTDVNDDIAIREFGDSLGDDSFATSESPRNCCCSTLYTSGLRSMAAHWRKLNINTGKAHQECVAQSKEGNRQSASPLQGEELGRAKAAASCVWRFCLQILFPALHPKTGWTAGSNIIRQTHVNSITSSFSNVGDSAHRSRW